MQTFLHFIRDADAYIFTHFAKIKEAHEYKKSGVINIEMAVFIFIGIVLASIFWGVAKKITSSAATGAQNSASTLFE